MQPLIHKPDAKVPIGLKLLTGGFLCVFIPVYWVKLGPANFLWFTDIAVIVTTIALWLEEKFLISMMAVGVLLPELVWNVDFFTRLITGSHLFGLGATRYMFNPDLPDVVRVLSFLFHVSLPLILLWSLYRLGYHSKAWIAQIVLAGIVLPLCYWVSDAQANINWVYGVGSVPQQWLPGIWYVLFLMVALPVVIYLPTHLVLKRLFIKHD
jgi:hypothetical protein